MLQPCEIGGGCLLREPWSRRYAQIEGHACVCVCVCVFVCVCHTDPEGSLRWQGHGVRPLFSRDVPLC